MLKKIALLTAAAGMLSTSVAVVAEPTVYGRISFGMKSVSGETDEADSQKIDDALGSRLGVKGTNDLGNGMTVDYLLEYGAGESMSLRHSNLTLNGSFGQFRLGKQTGVLYRYIGANTDQSWAVGGNEWYAIAGASGGDGWYNLNSNHSLRMKNIAAYRFGAGPGGDDPITFDLQIESVDRGGDEDESIDSLTVGAATALGPVKLQVAYADEKGDDMSPSLLAFGFRAPLGSAEIRGHMTSVDPDVDDYDDNEAWGLLVMNDFGGGYFGMIGVGNYTDGHEGAMAVAESGSPGAAGYVAAVNSPIDKDENNQENLYVSLTKSLGGGLSVIAEYNTTTKTVTDALMVGDDDGDGGTVDVAGANASLDTDDDTTSTFIVSVLQSF